MKPSHIKTDGMHRVRYFHEHGLVPVLPTREQIEVGIRVAQPEIGWVPEDTLREFEPRRGVAAPDASSRTGAMGDNDSVTEETV